MQPIVMTCATSGGTDPASEHVNEPQCNDMEGDGLSSCARDVPWNSDGDDLIFDNSDEDVGACTDDDDNCLKSARNGPSEPTNVFITSQKYSNTKTGASELGWQGRHVPIHFFA